MAAVLARTCGEHESDALLSVARAELADRNGVSGEPCKRSNLAFWPDKRLRCLEQTQACVALRCLSSVLLLSHAMLYWVSALYMSSSCVALSFGDSAG